MVLGMIRSRSRLLSMGRTSGARGAFYPSDDRGDGPGKPNREKSARTPGAPKDDAKK